jgi:hypothetical protein
LGKLVHTDRTLSGPVGHRSDLDGFLAQPAGETSRCVAEPRKPWPLEVSVAVAVAVAGCAPIAVIAWLLGAGARPLTGVVLFTLAAAGMATVSSWRAVLPAALLMWATDDGFVIHRFGVLSLDPRSVSALVVITGAALTAYGLAGLRRRLQPRLPHSTNR